jgi:hypothetical protein
MKISDKVQTDRGDHLVLGLTLGKIKPRWSFSIMNRGNVTDGAYGYPLDKVVIVPCQDYIFLKYHSTYTKRDVLRLILAKDFAETVVSITATALGYPGLLQRDKELLENLIEVLKGGGADGST